MKSNALHYISEEERMDIYDRLATKWALKMEARLREKQRRQASFKKAYL